MAKKEKNSLEESERNYPLAMSPEEQESRLINLSMIEAEKRMREGTASNQLLLHFINLGSSKSRLERAKLQEEVKLVKAKTETLEAAKENGELYANAIEAMKKYSGYREDQDDSNLY